MTPTPIGVFAFGEGGRSLADMSDVLLHSDLPLPVRRGKVRDVYDLGDRLLIVATDRISAFDCVMPNGIPDKGRLLTGISRFWFNQLTTPAENHLLSTEVADLPPSLASFAARLRGRIMLVRKARVVPIECVARGYLAGSGWKEYQRDGTVCGVKLPPGLKQCDRLPGPIFTPATKAETGHDENIPFERMCEIVGPTLAGRLREWTLRLYSQAAEYAGSRGILIADTKFEFGTTDDGRLILVDEVLTPDSSRFWPADRYQPGREQESFDKQFVRNWLERQVWNKTPPAPALPEDVVAGTRQRYVEAYERLTGERFA